MKKIILSAVLLLSLTAASIASPRKSTVLLNNLKSGFANTCEKIRESRDGFTVAKFNFQGKTVSVFEDEHGLIGFSLHYSLHEIPVEIKEAVNKANPGASILEATHFIYNDGRELDYVMIRSKKLNLVYEIKNNKARYFGRA